MPFFFSSVVQAQELGRSSTSPILPGATETEKVEERPTRGTSAQIRMESMQYFTKIKNQPDLNSSQLLSARVAATGDVVQSWGLEYGTDFSAGTFFRPGQSEFVVHDAHLTQQISPGKFSASVGRRKAFWSELDSRWQLGLWQPDYAIDALRVEEQGLTGLFLDADQNNFHVMGFVSPIFIPTMGPSVREQNGSLVSDSRWYTKPASELNFNQRINSINYKLDIPDRTALITNGSSAVMGQWGNRSQGPWVASAWGYKPVNELLLKRQSTKAIAADQADVVVSPDVTHHEIASVDFGYAAASVQGSISYLQDRPKQRSVQQDWVMQQLDPIKAYSGQLDYLVPAFLSRSFKIQLGYLKVEGGGVTDVQSNGVRDDIQLYDQRLKFTDAFSFGFQGELARIQQRALIAKLRYLYDRDQRGSLVNTELLYYPQKAWALLMGADFLGVDDESLRPSGFLNQFRANDRVYGGMTYVF